MAILVFGLLVVTTFLWWMLFDLWPELPARIPLWPFGDDAADREVERSAINWFGPPAVITVLATLLGIGMPMALTARAAGGGWLPVARQASIRLLPEPSRHRIVQPLRLGLTFAASCLLILVAKWWISVAEAPKDSLRLLELDRIAWPMVTAMLTGLGAASGFSKLRATKELTAFVQAGGTLPDGPDTA